MHYHSLLVSKKAQLPSSPSKIQNKFKGFSGDRLMTELGVELSLSLS